MSHYATSTAFEPAPVGNHAAILVKVIDLGTQVSEYKGEEQRRRQEIWTWELPNELRNDDQPFVISKFYTASLGEKATLTKDLTNWLGKPPKASEFTPKELLGKACSVTVATRETTGKNVVAGVSSLMKGVPVPEKPHNDLVYFSLREGEFDQEVFDSLSPKIQEMIQKSPEYIALVTGGVDGVEADEDQDIPF